MFILLNLIMLEKLHESARRKDFGGSFSIVKELNIGEFKSLLSRFNSILHDMGESGERFEKHRYDVDKLQRNYYLADVLNFRKIPTSVIEEDSLVETEPPFHCVRIREECWFMTPKDLSVPVTQYDDQMMVTKGVITGSYKDGSGIISNFVLQGSDGKRLSCYQEGLDIRPEMCKPVLYRFIFAPPHSSRNYEAGKNELNAFFDSAKNSGNEVVIGGVFKDDYLNAGIFGFDESNCFAYILKPKKE
jgi:hypothetical protein